MLDDLYLTTLAIREKTDTAARIDLLKKTRAEAFGSLPLEENFEIIQRILKNEGNEPIRSNLKERSFALFPIGTSEFGKNSRSVNKKGYVAVDFYDSSILYDFQSDTVTICDIDLFKKAPVVNNRGAAWYGTKRLKAPEEYIKGAAIDEQTNIFTLGALLFEFFGNFSDDEIKRRYRENRFVPCAYEHWQLSRESYNVAEKAVRFDKAQRYRTFAEFYSDWKKAVYASSDQCNH